MSANIGAEKVRTLSSELEALGRDSEIANTGELIEDLKQAYDEFLSIFKSEILEAC